MELKLKQVQEKAENWFEWPDSDRSAVTTTSACLFAMEVSADAMRDLRDQCAALREAIRLTLEENAHLADGDVCTLSRLKTALQPNTEVSGGVSRPLD